MQKSKVVLAAGALALLTVCAWASDPWKSKPYEKWTPKEVQKILNDSPWAKIITLPYDPYLNGDRPEYHDKVQIGRVPHDPVEDPVPNAVSKTFKPDATFVLRWNSARTVRRALYRDAVLRAISPAGAARRYLSDDPNVIELVLIAVGQTRLPPAERSTLLQKTYLRLQPSGRQIFPTRVRVRSGVDNLNDEGYIFEFPRKLANGSPAIPQQTAQIDFFLQVGVRIFQAKFRPEEMVGSDGADAY